MKKFYKNKIVLLTGATDGIGKELALRLDKLGSQLILISRDNEKLKELKKDLIKSESNHNFFQCDLSNINKTLKTIDKIDKKFDRIDIIFNNAAVFYKNEIKNLTDEEILYSFNLNLISPFLIVKKLYLKMIKNEFGRIVNLGSSSSYIGFKEGSLYSTTKHGILGLSRSLSAELKEYGIKVLCVSPGSVDTKMGRVNKNQDFTTFINKKDLSKLILHTLKYQNQILLEELRINRMEIK